MSKAKSVKILIGGVHASVDADESLILKKAEDKMKRAGFSTSTLHFRLYKKSVDARRREDIRFVCTVLAEGILSQKACTESRLKNAEAKLLREEALIPTF